MMKYEKLFKDYGFFTPAEPIMSNVNAVKFIGKLKEIKDDFEKYYNSETSISEYLNILEHYRKDDDTEKEAEDLSLSELIEYTELSDFYSIETGTHEILCKFIDYMNIPKKLLKEITETSDDDLNSALTLSFDDEDRHMIGIAYTEGPFSWNIGGYRDRVFAGYKSKEELPGIILETLKPYLDDTSHNPITEEIPEFAGLIEYKNIPVLNFKERVNYL